MLKEHKDDFLIDVLPFIGADDAFGYRLPERGCVQERYSSFRECVARIRLLVRRGAIEKAEVWKGNPNDPGHTVIFTYDAAGDAASETR